MFYVCVCVCVGGAVDCVFCLFVWCGFFSRFFLLCVCVYMCVCVCIGVLLINTFFKYDYNLDRDLSYYVNCKMYLGVVGLSLFHKSSTINSETKLTSYSTGFQPVLHTDSYNNNSWHSINWVVQIAACITQS